MLAVACAGILDYNSVQQHSMTATAHRNNVDDVVDDVDDGNQSSMS